MSEDEVQVHSGTKAGMVVSLRLGSDDAELLARLQQLYGERQSAILRRGLYALASRLDPTRPGSTGGSTSIAASTIDAGGHTDSPALTHR